LEQEHKIHIATFSFFWAISELETEIGKLELGKNPLGKER
jgi:hypothetical protein